jgi:putative ABC transport system substrate-binding protein
MSLRRREFIAGLGGAAAAWPLAARAQQRGVPVIGYLAGGTPELPLFKSLLASLLEGLSQIGYMEGRDFTIEYRWANYDLDRLPQLAAELVQDRVAVIFAGVIDAVLAAKAATTTIPIVFALGGDPVELGLVTSLNRPGGNLTGTSYVTFETTAKMVELLHEAVPNARLAAALVNPRIATNHETFTREAEKAARILGLEFRVFEAASVSEIGSAFAMLVQLPAPLLLIEGDGFFISRFQQIVPLTVRHRIPAIFPLSVFPAAGGLMSYGGNYFEAYRIAGGYIGHILKGERPADLPVQRVTKVELAINMNAAKAIGIDVPRAVLVSADEVIE